MSWFTNSCRIENLSEKSESSFCIFACNIYLPTFLRFSYSFKILWLAIDFIHNPKCSTEVEITFPVKWKGPKHRKWTLNIKGTQNLESGRKFSLVFGYLFSAWVVMSNPILNRNITVFIVVLHDFLLITDSTRGKKLLPCEKICIITILICPAGNKLGFI